MNNWRLLLLALVAVFQPIASFTEGNHFNGRQQRCDRLSSTPLQDTRSLHGIYQLRKTKTALRYLNNRDEIYDKRHNGQWQRDSTYSGPSTEKRLLYIREREVRPSIIATRAEYRLERHSNEPSRDRVFNVREGKSVVRIEDLKHRYITRRVVNRNARVNLRRRNDRGLIKVLRDSSFRDNHEAKRYGNERLSKNSFSSPHETPRREIRSREYRLILNRDARYMLRRSTDEVSRLERTENMKIYRERLNEMRHKSSTRIDSRRNIDELAENTPLVHRDRDMRIRLNFREERRENREYVNANQPLSIERLSQRREQRGHSVQSRPHNTENSDRNQFSERMQMARKIIRESRMLSDQDERGIRQGEMKHRETRNEMRENSNDKLLRVRTQLDRRNIYDFRIMNSFGNRRDVNIRREIDNKERFERENNNNKIILERLQMGQRNFREFIITNVVTRKVRDIDTTREIRHNDRLSRETRRVVGNNFDRTNSRDMVRMEKNIRYFRTVNTPNDSDVDSRQQIRYNERRSTEIRREAREIPEYRLSRETIQMDRRHMRESRIINAQNERVTLDTLSERRHERNSRETRNEIKKKTDFKLVREVKQVDRRDIRDSRIIIGNERDTESRREIRYNARLSRQVRSDSLARQSRVEPGSFNRIMFTEERENSLSDRRPRSADRQNSRHIKTEVTLTRSAERRSEVFHSRVQPSDKIENMERESRSRNVQLTRNHERIISGMMGKAQPENESTISNWQYVLYTMQAAYLCALFMQILTPSLSEKSHKMNLRWLGVHYNPIKVD